MLILFSSKGWVQGQLNPALPPAPSARSIKLGHHPVACFHLNVVHPVDVAGQRPAQIAGPAPQSGFDQLQDHIRFEVRKFRKAIVGMVSNHWKRACRILPRIGMGKIVGAFLIASVPPVFYLVPGGGPSEAVRITMGFNNNGSTYDHS